MENLNREGAYSEINLSFTGDMPLVKCFCSQYDTGRLIVPTFYMNGWVYTASDIYTRKIYMIVTLPNGEEISILAYRNAADNSHAFFELPIELTSQAGICRAKCVMEIKNGPNVEMVYGTNEFLICVNPSPAVPPLVEESSGE